MIVRHAIRGSMISFYSCFRDRRFPSENVNSRVSNFTGIESCERRTKNEGLAEAYNGSNRDGTDACLISRFLLSWHARHVLLRKPAPQMWREEDKR